MKISYYPGCTLKTKAKNLETSALASLNALGVEVEELERWNCCGAVYSLTDDDLIHQIAPVRDLIRAKEQGADKLVTLCSMCYNTLARANKLMKTDEEKRDTINRFMDEEIDYAGEVEVVHFLSLIEQEIGWEKLKEKVKRPLDDLKVAPYYGCTLQRPVEIGIEPMGSFELMTNMLTSLGATVEPFKGADLCCGSYQVVGNHEAAQDASAKILGLATEKEVEALVTSCPLCEFNLGKMQDELIDAQKITGNVPIFYFTQLLAVALGLESDVCHFELNDAKAVEFLKNKNYVAA